MKALINSLVIALLALIGGGLAGSMASRTTVTPANNTTTVNQANPERSTNQNQSGTEG